MTMLHQDDNAIATRMEMMMMMVVVVVVVAVVAAAVVVVVVVVVVATDMTKGARGVDLLAATLLRC